MNQPLYQIAMADEIDHQLVDVGSANRGYAYAVKALAEKIASSYESRGFCDVAAVVPANRAAELAVAAEHGWVGPQIPAPEMDEDIDIPF